MKNQSFLLPGAVTLVLTLSADVAWLLLSGAAISMGHCICWYLLFSVLHMAAHEAGHLMGGSLSGYRFLLIQLGHIRLSLRNDGLCRLSVECQFDSHCVMIPSKENNPPYRCYLAGGVVCNLLLCTTGLVLCMISNNNFWGQLFFSGIPKIIGNVWPVCTEQHLSDGGALYLLDHSVRKVRHDYAMYLKLYEIRYRELSYDPRIFSYARNVKDCNDSLIFYNSMLELLKEETAGGRM